MKLKDLIQEGKLMQGEQGKILDWIDEYLHAHSEEIGKNAAKFQSELFRASYKYGTELEKKEFLEKANDALNSLKK